ncbi:hypothetical protein [Sphingobium ummariense]
MAHQLRIIRNKQFPSRMALLPGEGKVKKSWPKESWRNCDGPPHRISLDHAMIHSLTA